ncbi:MAG TPA: cbb3-type cytochrome c oxidase subunit I [Longimicrobiales bacterium]|nr:cbb3-type cytochrome c oxidase subunit I [Longimicrobiales bacterium]
MAALTPIAVDPLGYELPDDQRRVLRWTLYLGYAALTAGVFHGLANALSYGGISILGWFPGLSTYYQGLTAHGVANVLIFTFTFSNAFLPLMTARALSRPLSSGLLWASFLTLVAGNVLAIYAILGNKATVLYTSYAPLQAHWTYYVGLVLVVVSTWLALLNMLVVLRGWRKEHRDDRIPLLAYISIVSYIMWGLASLPIAVEFIGFLIPWSLGIMEHIDPLLTRTLFWFTGHAIVYAWLLPAYVSWYALIPRQVNGAIISDSYTRIVWIMFLLLSIPTGMHHQYTDPGISEGMKAVHGVLTFGVFFPSLATAFSVMAALEIGGRRRGGTGLVGWIRKLPWGDPSVTAQILAMLTFILGGATGLVNASFTMNQVIHNTTWVPGHFHMTVGTAVALTLMGVAFWLIPYLTRRALFSRVTALWSVWTYTIGVLIFARGMISGGLAGMPRRTFLAEAAYTSPAWRLPGILTAVGGTLMFIGVMLFFVVIGLTIVAGKRGQEPVDVPVSGTLTAPAHGGWEKHLDNLWLWVGVAVVLILIAYGPFFLGYTPNFVSPGFKLF